MSHATTANDRSLDSILFLRRALLADAAMSGGAGLLGLPASLLRYAGAALIPFVAFVAYVGTRDRLARPAVWTVIVCNALWAAGSLLLLTWLAPTVLGYVFVVAQAAAVAIFGELQLVGLRPDSAK